MFLKNIIGFSQPIIPSYISNSFLKNLWLSVETQRGFPLKRRDTGSVDFQRG